MTWILIFAFKNYTNNKRDVLKVTTQLSLFFLVVKTIQLSQFVSAKRRKGVLGAYFFYGERRNCQVGILKAVVGDQGQMVIFNKSKAA